MTHDQARRLIQQATDGALHQNLQTALRAHLSACADCRSYAAEVRELENTLRRVMHRQWDLRPAPLRLEALRASNGTGTSMILAIRKGLASLVVMALVFGLWQFRATSGGVPRETAPSIRPNPTPSMQSTGTRPAEEKCAQIRYRVQEGDTLQSIAAHFGTSGEAILATTGLQPQAFRPGIEVRVPVCGSTPTGTAHPPSQTIEIPSTNPVSITPGG